MKNLLSLFSFFLFLLIPLFAEDTNAETENSSGVIVESSNISSENIYARKGSRSSSSRSFSKSKNSKTKNSTQKKKSSDKKSGFFGGFGGLITGLIGGALLASLLSGMGLEGLAEFAGILMWGVLGLLAFFLIRSFLAKRNTEKQRNKEDSFSSYNS